MPWFKNISRLVGKKRIPGTFVPVFYHSKHYKMISLEIYADGMIGQLFDMVPFEQFKERVRSGWYVTQPPEGARIEVFDLVTLVATQVRALAEPEDFIKEVADEIQRLNGRPTTSDRCLGAYNAYLKKPSAAARDKLKKTYNDVPSHKRVYILGDMDALDWPILAIIDAREMKQKGAPRHSARKRSSQASKLRKSI